MKKIVLIPTYNEKENVSAILHAVLGLSSDYHVLIIDDNSPDGTAAIVDSLMGKFIDRLFILKRPGKQGLGTAYIQGFKWALDKNYEYIFEMDADFSHNPNDLDRLLNACEENGADVSIGSRYVRGGETENWPIDRKIYSLGGSAYTRLITGMPIKDPTAGFICYKNKVLADINLDTIQRMVDEKKIKGAIDFDMMMAHRLAGKNDLVKILGRGELKSKLTVTAHKFTASAKAAIEAAGGEAVTL